MTDPVQGVGRPAAPPRFDRIARAYRWAEYLALGPLLHLTRSQFLSQLSACRQALLLGDGDGRFAANLLRCAPRVHIHAVDGSRTMLHLLHQRCLRGGHASRVRCEQNSVLASAVSPETDLVATHFLLDCLAQPELEALAMRLAQKVRPGCLWTISEFGYPRHPVSRFLAKAYIRLLYMAFRLLTGLQTQRLPNIHAALRPAGFQLLQRRTRLGGFLYAELWQLRAPSAPDMPKTQPEHGYKHQPQGER